MNAMQDLRAEAQPVRLKFEIGARTLLSVRRSLVRVPLTLAEARSGLAPVLPPLDRAADGYTVTSLPENQMAALAAGAGGMLPFVRQRYTRYYLDFAGTYDEWFAQPVVQRAAGIAAQGEEDRGARRAARSMCGASARRGSWRRSIPSRGRSRRRPIRSGCWDRACPKGRTFFAR